MTIRASSLDRLLTCGASHRLIAAVEPTLLVSRDTAVAARGTAIHTAAHAKLIAEYGTIAPNEGHTDDTKLYDSLLPYDRWTAKFYIEHILEKSAGMALLVEQHLTAEIPNPQSPISNHQDPISNHLCLSGHIDCYAITPDGKRAHIFDLKAGHDPVDPAEINEQICAYIVLLYCSYPTLEEISADIIQPALESEDRITAVTVTGRDDLEHLKNNLFCRIREAIAGTTLNSDTLRQCRYCPAAHRCPAFNQELQKIMQLALTETDLEKAGKADLRKLVALKEAGGRIEQPLENARLELVELLKRSGGAASLPDGKTVTLSIVPGRRYFKDPFAAKETLKKLPLTAEDRFKAVDINIPNLEAVAAARLDIPESSKKPGQLTAKQWLKDMFAENLAQNTTNRIYIK